MEAFAIPDARDRLREAVDTLVGESIDGFSTHALGQDIVDIRRAIDRLEAESIRRLHRFHRERGAQADGGGSTVSWLRRACGMTVKAAAYRVHLARTLGELPATLDSARTGRASFSNVTMIAHLAEDVGVAQLAPFEHVLVGAAETFEPRAMRMLTQATRLRLDPGGVLADDNCAHERRWFECEQTYGGVFVLRGELDAEGGALVKTAIDALSHGMSRGEERLASQRRADALVDLAAIGREHTSTAALGGTGHADDPGAPPHRAGSSRPGLPLPGMRPSAPHGPKATTWCTRATAAIPTSRMWCSCVIATTGRYMKAAGSWSKPSISEGSRFRRRRAGRGLAHRTESQLFRVGASDNFTATRSNVPVVAAWRAGPRLVSAEPE